MPEIPSLEEWRILYEAAVRFHDLQPWTWLYEDQLIGVVNPEDGQTGYCSVMGFLGEHLALAVYLEAEGFHSFLRLRKVQGDSPAALQAFIEQRCLQASFEDREGLTQEDREVIRSLGLKFRGRQAWPCFRDCTPGYFPWYISAPQARFLTVALEQTMEVASRFRENPEARYGLRKRKCLVRVPQAGEEGPIWTDEWRPFPKKVPRPKLAWPTEGEPPALPRPAAGAKQGGIWELDYSYFPRAVQEGKGERPFYPQSIMVVDEDSYFILATELAQPGTLAKTLYTTLAGLLARVSLCPREIHVRREELVEYLSPLTQPLGLPVVQVSRLPALAYARREMESFFR